MLLIDAEILKKVSSALSNVPHVIVLGNDKLPNTITIEEVENRGKTVTFNDVTVGKWGYAAFDTSIELYILAATDMASIYYTGKDYQHGAILTHKNLLSSICNVPLSFL